MDKGNYALVFQVEAQAISSDSKLALLPNSDFRHALSLTVECKRSTRVSPLCLHSFANKDPDGAEAPPSKYDQHSFPKPSILGSVFGVMTRYYSISVSID